MLIFTLPLRVPTSKKKLFSLNLNIYRNAHFRTLSAAKVAFKHLFVQKYGKNNAERPCKCKLEYTIFWPTLAKADVANVGSIVDKFASDCLVECGYIEDDNWTVVDSVLYRNGGLDRANPRAELRLIEIGKK